MPKKGRPVGTTKANGYRVSPGRPRRKKIISITFTQKILNGFKNLLSR
tara:strand:+ start:166 stop:309 length:144 start_codon:yes stop_codon:yes gene_type:complete